MGKKESLLRTGRVCSCRLSLLSRLTLSQGNRSPGSPHNLLVVADEAHLIRLKSLA